MDYGDGKTVAYEIDGPDIFTFQFSNIVQTE